MSDLGAIRARADAATSGPWVYSDVIDNQHNVTRNKWDVAACSGGDLDPEGGDRDAQAARNAEFVAHARTDIPALCDEVERLKAERDMWRTKAEMLGERLVEQERVVDIFAEMAESRDLADGGDW